MTATITITPEQFGKVAAAAIARGLDVTSLLVKFTEKRLMACSDTTANLPMPDVPGTAFAAPCLLPTSLPETELSPADEDPTMNEIFADCL